MDKLSLQSHCNSSVTFTSNLSRIIKESKKLEALVKQDADIFELQQVADKINLRFRAIPTVAGNTVILNKYVKLQNKLTNFFVKNISPRLNSMKMDEKVGINQTKSIENTFSTLLRNAQSLYGRVSKSKESSVHKLIIGKKSHRFDKPETLKLLGFNQV